MFLEVSRRSDQAQSELSPRSLVALYNEKQLLIKNQVGKISSSQNKFTSVDNVPTDASVVMLVDDSTEVRNEM